MKISSVRDQCIAMSIAVVVCVGLIALLWFEIVILNHHTIGDISLRIRWPDVLVGLTIYLKTSIDFAMFIGRLMEKNKGLKGRIGIEIGTACGNAAGTLLVLLLWSFFREIHWLLAIMILIAAAVLFRLAEDGFEHIDVNKKSYPLWFRYFVKTLEKTLEAINRVLNPVLSKLIPSHTMKVSEQKKFFSLFLMAFTIPFILGLDDFAGYVPLFNVVNIFGFAAGVFIGHLILNILLYLSPKRTIALVKNPIISLLGSIAFVGLALWGIKEALHLLF